ncbi:FGGY family carbohydrate kinase [Ruegeria hyattellae]|uniref:FGGY family carbohydrate kinase n=1 Tax=Ruegeria hyattellae TaxID=3233337 RepID=UPI00355AF0B4
MVGDIAVLDVGKTNVDLWVARQDGTLLENRSVGNGVLNGPPWRHHDLNKLAIWLGNALSELCKQYPIQTLVPVGHGSGGVLVVQNPEGAGVGCALPMIDYEQSCPVEIDDEYRAMAGTFEDRGSPVMMASTHAARQILWMERADPTAFGRARHYLNIAQFWGWWLTGIAASEYSAMGAQSHLWNVPQRRWAPIVQDRGWQKLMPDFRPAWAPLGPVRKDLARRFGLPEDMIVLTGAHDSTANFFRYLAAGMTDFTLVSTGTWVVALSREADTATLDQKRGTTINADMEGNPVGGALTMGGREFSGIAGAEWNGQIAAADVLAKLVARGTMAHPSFGQNEGQFPGSARQGKISGPPPETQAERTALAVLHAAMLTVTCVDVLKGGTRLILDGTFLKEPLYAPLVAALCPGRPTEASHETQGVVAGAVRLANQRVSVTPPSLSLETVQAIAIPGLEDYASRWRMAAENKRGRS